MTVSNNFVNSFIHDIRPPRKWVACLHIYGATKIYIMVGFLEVLVTRSHLS